MELEAEVGIEPQGAVLRHFCPILPGYTSLIQAYTATTLPNTIVSHFVSHLESGAKCLEGSDRWGLGLAHLPR